jgi:hypothetical protein
MRDCSLRIPQEYLERFAIPSRSIAFLENLVTKRSGFFGLPTPIDDQCDPSFREQRENREQSQRT